MKEAIKTASAFMWVTLMPEARTDWSLSLTPLQHQADILDSQSSQGEENNQQDQDDDVILQIWIGKAI